MLRLLFIAIGGTIGSLLRYTISGMTYKYLECVYFIRVLKCQTLFPIM